MNDKPEMKLAGVIAYAQVDNANEAGELYKKAFAAKEIDRHAIPDGRLIHLHLEINNGALMLNDPFPEHGYASAPIQGITLHIVSNEPRVWWQRAVDAGLEIKTPLEVAFWGDLYGQLRDRFGMTWGIVGPTS